MAAGEVRDVRAYLRRAVANEAKSRPRRRYLKRAVAMRRTGDDRGVQLLDEAAADRGELWQALGALSQAQRTVLVLRYFEDLTEAETADVLGCSVGTVKSRAARGIARLEALVGGPAAARSAGRAVPAVGAPEHTREDRGGRDR